MTESGITAYVAAYAFSTPITVFPSSENSNIANTLLPDGASVTLPVGELVFCVTGLLVTGACVAGLLVA